MEYTAGTTGISLALVCAALGYRLHVVFSDAFSVEKCKTMLALGAEITDEPSDGGRITADLNKRMIATSKEISNSALIQGSAGYLDGALAGRSADVAYLGIGQLG